MRVLFLTPSVRLLGARQSLLTLLQRLPDDVQPLVVAPGESGLTQKLRESDIGVEVVPHGAWRKLTGRVKSQTLQMPRLHRISRRFSPDLVHSNEFHSNPQGVLVGRRGKLPITTHVRLGITPRQIRNYYLGDCGRIVVVSEACAHLFDGSGLEDRVRVVHNGVDLSRFQPLSGPSKLRQELGWGEDDLVLGLLGLISPRKNQLLAAEAVALARSRGVSARLILAGDAFKSTTEYGEELRVRIQRDDLRGSVHWMPFTDDVASVYAALDVNLLISAEEGFGRTIIEAAAMEIPSIGARTGGIPELIREGETGWLVDEGDAEALAGRMEALWRERGKAGAAGEKAREFVLERFTIERHVEKMCAVWGEAVG